MGLLPSGGVTSAFPGISASELVFYSGHVPSECTPFIKDSFSLIYRENASRDDALSEKSSIGEALQRHFLRGAQKVLPRFMGNFVVLCAGEAGGLPHCGPPRVTTGRLRIDASPCPAYAHRR